MENFDLQAYWDAVLRQDAQAMEPFLAPNAIVNWHCTNESFTAAEFVRANCEYPGQWEGEIQRVEPIPGGIAAVVHVYSADRALSFHAVAFVRLTDGKITQLDEYWGDDGPAPQWRQDKNIGRKIRD